MTPEALLLWYVVIPPKSYLQAADYGDLVGDGGHRHADAPRERHVRHPHLLGVEASSTASLRFCFRNAVLANIQHVLLSAGASQLLNMMRSERGCSRGSLAKTPQALQSMISRCERVCKLRALTKTSLDSSLVTQEVTAMLPSSGRCSGSSRT